MTAEKPPTVLSPEYRLTTIGMVCLVLLVAFENLAVTTVMPMISELFHGAHLYSLAFGGPLAVGVIGMVVAGNWADRRGPAGPLLASVGIFAIGLAIAGAATSMEMLVLGRLLHGLAGGAVNVALYVLVARVFPGRLHPAVFAGFAAAWVLPSLIGPFLGGLIAEHLGWRWVFFGVIALTIPALAVLAPALRRLPAAPSTAVPWSVVRIAAAAIVAIGVLTMDLAVGAGTLWGWALAATGGAGAFAALGLLLPRGTRTLRTGLPSVIALRGILSGGFISAEVYLPYLLNDGYHVDPVLTGASLTVGGIAWAIASNVHSRVCDRLSALRILTIGAVLLSVATTIVLIATVLHAGPVPTVLGWAVAGSGMGFSFPRLGTMTLALSTPTTSGFNSAALSISDSIGAALALTITGIVFTGFGGPHHDGGFIGAFTIAVLLSCLAVVAARRAGAGDPSQTVPTTGSDTAAPGPGLVEAA